MRTRGFTLIEQLVVLAIVALLGTLVVPVAQVQAQRVKEHELRAALWQIRAAIDAYKAAAEAGRIRRTPGDTGYPPTLELLVEGVPDMRDPGRRKIFFLRRVPRDPFHSDPSTADAATWAVRAYRSEPDDFQDGDDVYDVRSRSAVVGLNGIPVARW